MIFKTRKRSISLLMIFFIVFSSIFTPDYTQVVQAADQAVIAAWNITSEPDDSIIEATSGTAATVPVAVTGSVIVVSGSAITSGAELTTNANFTGYASGSVNGLVSNGWNDGAYKKYWQIVLSSRGYENLTFTAQTRSSGTGPRDFVVQYSTDCVDFTDVSSFKNTGSMAYIDTVNLPEAAGNSDILVIRLMMSSNIRVKDETTPVASGGNANINNIEIKGTPVIESDIVTPAEASLPSGEILSTDLISLSCTTAGASITYSINDGPYVSYSAPFTIPEFPAVLRTKASSEGMTDSVITTYEYTQKKTAAVTANPNGGTVTKEQKVELSCSTLGAKIQYSIDNSASWLDYTEPFTLPELPAKVMAKAILDGALESVVSEFDFTEKTGDKYNIYFGQLHSHTDSSDGLGTVEEAFEHAEKDVYNLDFLAVTDHSNSLENTAGTANISDGSSSSKWLKEKEAANAVTNQDFVGIVGYEMTWSNGTGHMNTFNTDGFENRNTAKYQSATGLLEYYNTLKTAPTSISQFNHPGDTFGDFKDFSYYDADIDQLISLIEVGNGEGPVHGSGYFPSYEYYTRALDKGWHVAPTNNQDNHKSFWGDANTARSVVLADSLTRENIYDAMRNMRVYATEDNNLSIYYTLNDEIMGSALESKPESINIKVDLKDDGKTPAKVTSGTTITSEPIGKVEVIANGGKVVADKEVTTSEETVEFRLKPDYSYYYIRVTQDDNDIAVTAPVWVGEADKAGISKTVTTTALPVKGEPIDITSTLFNNEDYDMNITSLTYSINGEVIHTADLAASSLEKVTSLSGAVYTFQYVSENAGTYNIDVKLTAELNGVDKVYTDVLKVKFTDPAMVTRILIDGSHRNDYVNGYYSGNMSNLIALGAASQTQIKVVTEVTDEALKGASAFLISAPLKRSNYTVNGTAYNPQEFSDEFIAMVKRYVDNGGNLIICGIADYQDYSEKSGSVSEYKNATPYQTSTQLNKLLEAVGATTRINNDQVMDNDNNGGQPYRLYFTEYNKDAEVSLLSGIEDSRKYSFYSGCSILLDEQSIMSGTTTWLVKGHTTTYSNDTKGTLPADPVDKGDVYALAVEKLPGGGGMLIGGTVFTSNFEVQSNLTDNYDTMYSNTIIMNNAIKGLQEKVPITSIAQARKGEIGDVFAVEGYVTAGTVDGNSFYDSIYIQDETGGMDIYPISEEGILPGQKMRIIGSLDTYQGDIELRVIRSEKLSEDINLVTPAILTTKEAMDYDSNGGRLVKVTGKVTDVILANNSLSAFKIMDDSDEEARVLIDGYILDSTGKNNTDSIVKIGNQVNVTGIVYYNPEGVNIRVRDRAEIMLVSTEEPVPTPSITPIPSITPEPSGIPTPSGTPTPSLTPTPSITPTPSVTPNPSVTPIPSITPVPSGIPTPTSAPSRHESRSPSSSKALPTPTPMPVITIDLRFDNWDTAIKTITELKNKMSGSSDTPAKVFIYLEESAPINTEILKASKGADIDLIFKTTTYQWMINGRIITDDMITLGNIDLSVTSLTNNNTVKEIRSAFLKGLTKSKKVLKPLKPKAALISMFSYTYQEKVPHAGILNLIVGTPYVGRSVFISRYQSKTKKLIPCGYFIVDSEGNIPFKLTESADYIISLGNPVLPFVLTKTTLHTGEELILRVWNIMDQDTVTFISNKRLVASIDKYGKITARKAGTATITTKIIQNGVTYTYQTKVTVK